MDIYSIHMCIDIKTNGTNVKLVVRRGWLSSFKLPVANESFWLNDISLRLSCSHAPATFDSLTIDPEKLFVISLSRLVSAVLFFETLSAACPGFLFLVGFWEKNKTKEKWNWILSLERAAETEHQDHFVFILSHWVQIPPHTPLRRPFPRPCYWHRTVFVRTNWILWPTGWEIDWDQSRTMCPIITFSVGWRTYTASFET